MFSGPMKETTQKEIIMHDISYCVMVKNFDFVLKIQMFILQYLYSDGENDVIIASDALHIFLAANKFMIQPLQQAAGTRIITLIWNM